MFGVGPGGSPPDFEAFDVVDKNRMEMVEESVDIITRLWSSDPPYDIQGKYWQFHVRDNVLPDIGVGKMTVPFQQPHPPIMLPSMSRGSSSAKVTARRGWNMISANFVPEDIAIGHWHDWAGERARLGLPLEPHKYRAGRTILVCDTDEEAQAYLKHQDCALRWYFHYIIGLTGHGGFVGMLKHDPEMPDSEVTPDYCIENIVIAGSPRTVAEKLAAFREKVGPFETLIISHHDWVHRQLWERHMHLAAHEMMPILRDLTGTRHLVEERMAAE
jgi:alkanesulfonate monooxygenase SsuD/methylene tetrahydromethanopterin reductase-like flavin-dependent oxidoreductase (luciferase family)